MSTDPYACYFDASNCLVCPEVAAIAAVPARIERMPVVGWNAGANSIQIRDDSHLHTVFTMPPGTAGAVVGLKGSRARQTLPVLVEHGWHFQSVGAANMAQVMEGGVTKTSLVARAADDQFEIRRIHGAVTYWKNGTLVYTSLVPSTGAKLVNACLYVSGDAVGAAA